VIINGEEKGNPLSRALIGTAAAMVIVCLVAALILVSLPLLRVEPGSGLMIFIMALIMTIPVLPMVLLVKALKDSAQDQAKEENSPRLYKNDQ
jgi:cobalamin biosynthesis protein CobD/CbiB